ncbi:sigma-54-dependent transcriptional regulator [Gayadomonas joobiniege]|uniref:sigma-54-dependent transcriptional regulator n=1 Tax=Gayadomonas joobiniege TaxID=1234606 RepID=UPI0003674CDE|nr:sigma-54 dependent transcriptional regulator [Gayadomonas joobiniege]
MPHKKCILIVEDDKALCEAIADTLSLAGYQVKQAYQVDSGLIELKQTKIDLVISDVQMPNQTGLDLLSLLKTQFDGIPILLMTAYATVSDAVSAMQQGAIDYLSKPFSPQVLLNLVDKALPSESASGAVFNDPASHHLLNLARRVAQSSASVLITGASGTGKEILAKEIHQSSARNQQAFVAINCAAIPETMLEATLFGYQKGAFTGATQACPGKFEQANGGTLLLDEITEMALPLQAKLLRVLQEKQVERLGASQLIDLDVRIIATSNRHLRQAVDAGQFREDLYYRLNVFPLHWPTLAQRPGDIMPLAHHLLKKHQSDRCQLTFSQQAEQKLLAYHWPGNVRELENVMQRALILKQGRQINAQDIFFESQLNEPQNIAAQVASEQQNQTLSELKLTELQLIQNTLNECQGKRGQAAQKLGISARTLRYKIAKMRDLGMQIPD